MDDPPRAAGDREGVRTDGTDGSDVFAECLSHMREGRTDICADGVDLLRKFSDQTVKKRDRVFRRSFSHLPVSVSGDLIDSEQDRNAEAAQVHMINGDIKTVGARQVHAREGWTDVSPADFTKPIALQASIQSRAAQLWHQTSEPHKRVIEREAGAPAIGENDHFVFESERTGIFRTRLQVGRKRTRLPFSHRLAIDAIPRGENGVFLPARLDRFSNAWGGRRRAVRSTCQLLASFSFSSHSRFPRTGLAKRPSCNKGRARSKELMGPLSRQDSPRAIISYAS
jgi:hypothetical protein